MTMGLDDAERRFREPRGIARLWAGLLLAPAAWALQMAATYAVIPALCRANASGALLVVISGLGLLVALGGLAFAFLNWRDAGKGWRATGKAAVDRARFMAVTGGLLAAYVTVIIAVQLALSAGLDHCA